MNDISSKTAISIGLVVTLIGAAIGFGILYQKVLNLETQVQEIKMDIKEVSQNVSALRDMFYQKIALNK